MFYEVSKPGLTTDHQIYVQNGVEAALKLWRETKSGFLSNFTFGAFAYARLDEQLADSPLWCDAPREEGHDPMGLTPQQPNIEFFCTECYGGPAQNADLPLGGESAFSIIPELFNPRSKGAVTLQSKDPLENPVVDHNYLADPLDLLVLSEACRYANEVVMKGKGTKDIVKGAWPSGSTHHDYTTREDWVPFVKKHATTFKHPTPPGAASKLMTDRLSRGGNL
jgi:choline dehydrogenase-like flavoprotein